MVLEELMLHRKAIHNAVCRLSLTNQCERDQETCWFNHPPHKNTVPAQGVENSVNPKTIIKQNMVGSYQEDFQENPQVEAPSLTSPLMGQMMDQMMTVMKSEMTKMFQSMMNHR